MGDLYYCSRKHAPTYWPEVIFYNQHKYPCPMGLNHSGLNSCDLHFEHAMHHVRDAVVSGNMFKCIDSILA